MPAYTHHLPVWSVAYPRMRAASATVNVLLGSGMCSSHSQAGLSPQPLGR